MKKGAKMPRPLILLPECGLPPAAYCLPATE